MSLLASSRVARLAARATVARVPILAGAHAGVTAVTRARTFTAAPARHTDAQASTRSAPAATPSSGVVDGATLFGAPFPHLSLAYSPSLQSLTVTMNRPDLHNAFNEHVIRELSSLFRTLESTCSTDPNSALGSLRAVVLTGAGASFSAGADLHWMKKMKDYTHEENLQDSKLLFHMFLLLNRCPVPVIARVNGAALGGGVGLVAACDMAVSVQSAQFGLTEVKLGLSPAVISSFVLSKLSPASANYFFLTGSRFSAAEAQQHGLVNKVVDSEAALDAAVNQIVSELALNSPTAVRATKQLISHIRRDPRIPESESFCTSLIAKLRVSEEGQEGLNAFFDKRKAAWIPQHLANGKKKK